MKMFISKHLNRNFRFDPIALWPFTSSIEFFWKFINWSWKINILEVEIQISFVSKSILTLKNVETNIIGENKITSAIYRLVTSFYLGILHNCLLRCFKHIKFSLKISNFFNEAAGRYAVSGASGFLYIYLFFALLLPSSLRFPVKLPKI